jgi:hypothetical protein
MAESCLVTTEYVMKHMKFDSLLIESELSHPVSGKLLREWRGLKLSISERIYAFERKKSGTFVMDS